jgi:hypothetical protein
LTDPQPELVAVPAPTARHPGRCRLPTRYGAEKPCPKRDRGPRGGLDGGPWTQPNASERVSSARPRTG